MTKSAFTKKYKRFCSMLVEAREEAGLTQIELSKKLKSPQSYVSKYERGERRLDVIEFLEIAGAIGFDAAKFLKRLERGD